MPKHLLKKVLWGHDRKSSCIARGRINLASFILAVHVKGLLASKIVRQNIAKRDCGSKQIASTWLEWDLAEVTRSRPELNNNELVPQSCGLNTSQATDIASASHKAPLFWAEMCEHNVSHYELETRRSNNVPSFLIAICDSNSKMDSRCFLAYAVHEGILCRTQRSAEAMKTPDEVEEGPFCFATRHAYYTIFVPRNIKWTLRKYVNKDGSIQTKSCTFPCNTKFILQPRTPCFIPRPIKKYRCLSWASI